VTVARPPSAQRLPWLLTPPRVGEQTPADLDTPFTVQAGLVVVTGTITFTLLPGMTWPGVTRIPGAIASRALSGGLLFLAGTSLTAPTSEDLRRALTPLIVHFLQAVPTRDAHRVLAALTGVTVESAVDFGILFNVSRETGGRALRSTP